MLALTVSRARRPLAATSWILTLVLVAGCGGDAEVDASVADGGAGLDSGTEDAALRDAGLHDGGSDVDGGPTDAGADGGAGVGGPLRAFPTAVGAAAAITGGRGGSVYHVTQLGDSGPGSLRDALSESNRTVVFDISGVIELTSRLTATVDNITLAGQTAPGAGITIDGDAFMVFEADNWIVRHLRFRGSYASDTVQDSLTVLNSERVYLDHCSMSFGADEAGTMTQSSGSSSTSIGQATMAHCLLAESKTGTIFKGDAGFTSYLNLYYNITHRFPNLASNEGGAFDVINNVAWNYAFRAVRANDGIDLVHLGNYADLGTTPLRNDRINQYQYGGDAPRIHTAGNVFVAVNTQDPNTYTPTQMNADNRLMWSFFDGTQSPYVEDERLPNEWFEDTPRALLGVPPEVLTAEEALARVTTDVGANRRLEADGTWVDNADELDRGWVANVAAGVYTSRLGLGEYAVPELPSETRSDAFDTDRDGMPDVWETAEGLDPDRDDHAEDADGDGYENLEEYLDLIDL